MKKHVLQPNGGQGRRGTPPGVNTEASIKHQEEGREGGMIPDGAQNKGASTVEKDSPVSSTKCVNPPPGFGFSGETAQTVN